jgi:hypothetical protein
MALAEAIVDLRQRTAPVVLARDRGLPVLEALAPLLPDGLRRGAVHTVDGGPGATVLALALPAAASVAGSWTAVVGAPSVGLLAGLELGIARERLLVVPEPPRESWGAGGAPRLVARAREREAVLVALPERGRASWPGADVRLTVQRSSWIGPCELGAGRLVARRADVVMSGRGAAARERRATLWLPGADGTVQVCDG